MCEGRLLSEERQATKLFRFHFGLGTMFVVIRREQLQLIISCFGLDKLERVQVFLEWAGRHFAAGLAATS